MYRTDKQFMKNPATSTSRIFIGNIAEGLIPLDLEDRFKTHGKILGLVLQRGFAFIQYEKEDEARAAIDKENGTLFRGRKLNVKQAFDKRPNQKPPFRQQQQHLGNQPPQHQPTIQKPPNQQQFNQQPPPNQQQEKPHLLPTPVNSKDIKNQEQEIAPHSQPETVQEPLKLESNMPPESKVVQKNVRPSEEDFSEDTFQTDTFIAHQGEEENYQNFDDEEFEQPSQFAESDAEIEPYTPNKFTPKGGNDNSYMQNRFTPREHDKEPYSHNRFTPRQRGDNFKKFPSRDNDSGSYSHNKFSPQKREEDVHLPNKFPPRNFEEDKSPANRKNDSHEYIPPAKRGRGRKNFGLDYSSKENFRDGPRSKFYNREESFIQKPYVPPPVEVPHAPERNDCEIIVVSKLLTEYAEFIEQKLKNLGLIVDLLFPNEDVPIGRVLANISSRGCLFAILVMPQNEENRSLTLNILHGIPQEHRNMPIEDALTLISRNFDAYMRGDKTFPTNGTNGTKMSLEDRHPEQIQLLFNLLAENRQLTTVQYEKLLKYLEERKELQSQFEKAEGTDSAANPEANDKAAELQNRILNILNKSNSSQSESPKPVSAPPETTASVTPTPLLNDPSVQKALDSLLSGEMFKGSSDL